MLLDEYQKIHHAVTGEILSRMSSIDRMMAVVIATYVAKSSKIDEAVSVVIQMEFEDKRRTVKRIIESSVELRGKYDNLPKQMSKMQELRNVFAHNPLFYPSGLMKVGTLKKIELSLWPKIGENEERRSYIYDYANHEKTVELLGWMMVALSEIEKSLQE